jgi:hypothetical protein
MILRHHPRLEDPVLRACCEISRRFCLGLPLDRAALVAIGARFEVDAIAIAAGMLLRHAFDPDRLVDTA